MNQAKTRIYAWLCAVAMTGAGLTAVVWWGVSWITIVLLAFGVTCLAAILHAWMTARRIDQLLDRPTRGAREAGKRRGKT